MAKYDWTKIRNEYISKNITLEKLAKKYNMSMNTLMAKSSKEKWSGLKKENSRKIAEKIQKKTQETIANKEVDRVTRIDNIADTLADKIEQAICELETYIVKNKKKTKVVEYDEKIGKPTKETIEEDEIIETMQGSVDRLGLKQLTGALKDIKEIVSDKGDNNASSLADLIQQAYNNKESDEK